MSQVYWLALTGVPGIGGVTLRKLLERFGGIEAIFSAADEELLGIPRITPEIVARLRAISIPAVEAELVALAQAGMHIVTWDDIGYPANLRLASDAPPLLFVRGELRPADDQAVAIVGTRQPSDAATLTAETLARELAGHGLTVVSGLAQGIDTAAHRGALQATHGRTLAVLGSGLQRIHPRENTALAETIASRGALLSEFRPDTPVRGPNLMARDRILSGLSRAVIVVEASENSGSLDTAAKAQRQNRPVFAVPGSPGTDALLAAGAQRLDLQTIDWDEFSEQLGAGRASGEEIPTQLSLWEM